MVARSNRGLDAYRSVRGDGGAELVRQYSDLVKRIAHHLMGRLPPSVQLDDLVQSGMLGLMEAASQYNPDKGASFETYAGIRIRGAMIDEMRRGDWVPRSVHREARRISEAISVLEARLGREATDQEIAKALGLELDDYYDRLADVRGAQLFSLDSWQEEEGHQPPIDDKGLGKPLAGLEREQFQQQLSQAIDRLPERERLVLGLYYQHELNLKEIGAVLEVSESRVSQIHSQAVARLRARLSDWQLTT